MASRKHSKQRAHHILQEKVGIVLHNLQWIMLIIYGFIRSIYQALLLPRFGHMDALQQQGPEGISLPV